MRLVSPHGSVGAITGADPDLRQGVVSMVHGWGPLPDDEESGAPGSNTNRLTSLTVGCEPINAMPIMTGVPLRIERLG